MSHVNWHTHPQFLAGLQGVPKMGHAGDGARSEIVSETGHRRGHRDECQQNIKTAKAVSSGSDPTFRCLTLRTVIPLFRCLTPESSHVIALSSDSTRPSTDEGGQRS